MARVSRVFPREPAFSLWPPRPPIVSGLTVAQEAGIWAARLNGDLPVYRRAGREFYRVMSSRGQAAVTVPPAGVGAWDMIAEPRIVRKWWYG